MPALSYLTRTPDGSDMNRLLAEFDRRLTVALSDGCSPLIPGPNGGDAAGLNELWDELEAFTCGVVGRWFRFTDGGSDLPYHVTFDAGGTWPEHDQSALDTIAGAAAEVSRDTTNRVIYVASTTDTDKLDYSLTAQTRDDAGTIYWLAVGTGGQVRQQRRHAYAVAELVVEGLSTLTVPIEWDRFQCYRVHNLSGSALTVTVETDGEPNIITVKAYGCRSFRRIVDRNESNEVTSVYYDDSLNYFWKFRNESERPRFLLASGTSIPEKSQQVNPLAHPHVILRWFTMLDLKLDPRELPDLRTNFTMFQSPASANRFGDLLHHKGEVWSICFPVDTTQPPIITEGEFNGYATIQADMDAIFVDATESGGIWTLAPKSGHPGDAAKGMYLFAPGTNLLSKPDIDGHRFFRALNFAVESVADLTFSEDTFRVIPDASVTMEDDVLLTSAPTYDTISVDIPTFEVDAVTPPATLAASAAATPPTSTAYQYATDFRLTPMGWRAYFEHVYDTSGAASSASSIPPQPITSSLYDDIGLDGKFYHRGEIRVTGRGWPLDGTATPALAGTGDANFVSPNAPRGRITREDDGTLGLTAPGFDYHLIGGSGADLTATTRTVENIHELTALRGLVTTAGTEGQYGGVFWNCENYAKQFRVFAQPDNAHVPLEVRDLACDDASSIYSQRVALAAGSGLTDTDQWDDIFVQPLLPEHWNLLAYHVNAWTRCEPLVTALDVLLYGTVNIDGTPIHRLAYFADREGKVAINPTNGIDGTYGYPPPAWHIWSSNTVGSTWFSNVGITTKTAASLDASFAAAVTATDTGTTTPQYVTVVFSFTVTGNQTVTYVTTAGGLDYYECSADVQSSISTVYDSIEVPWWKNIGSAGTPATHWERAVDPPPTYDDVTHISYAPTGSFTPVVNAQETYFATAAAGFSGFIWIDARDVKTWAEARGLIFVFEGSGIPMALEVFDAVDPAELVDLEGESLSLYTLLQTIDATTGPNTLISVTTGDPAPSFTAPTNYAFNTYAHPSKFARFRPLEPGEEGGMVFLATLGGGGGLVPLDGPVGGFIEAVNEPSDNFAPYIWRKSGTPWAAKEVSLSLPTTVDVAAMTDGRPEAVQDIDAKRLKTHALVTSSHDPTGRLVRDSRTISAPWGKMDCEGGWLFQSKANYELGPEGIDRTISMSTGSLVIGSQPDGVSILAPPAGQTGIWQIYTRRRCYFNLAV